MSNLTDPNEKYKGLVVACEIPAELHERDGHQFYTVGTTMPIHCASLEEVEKLAATTHHYCGIFTEELLAPLGELALVRLDEKTAEKVFLNRAKRLLLISSDGRLAQWRFTGTFESGNRLLAGAPILAAPARPDAARPDPLAGLASIVIARRRQHYAVSSFEGDGGYFETPLPWETKDIEEGKMIYGSMAFDTREELREYVTSLPPSEVNADAHPRPILWRGKHPRLVLVAQNGRQLMHHYLTGVLTDEIEYL